MKKDAPQVSAGLLMYRRRGATVEVFLAHPGGPFFTKKDAGYWGIPKGLIDPGEDPLAAAKREFEEETGLAPAGPFIPLGEIVQKSGKIVHAWAFAGDWEDGRQPAGNTFALEWPPGSGSQKAFQEVDKATFFHLNAARRKMVEAQHAFLDRLVEQIDRN